MDDLVAELQTKIQVNGYTKWLHKYVNLPPDVTEELKRRLVWWRTDEIKDHLNDLQEPDRDEKFKEICLGVWISDPHGDK